MCGSLLVAYEYVAQLICIVVQTVVDRYDVSSRITEYGIDVLGYKRADKRFGSCDFLAHSDVSF